MVRINSFRGYIANQELAQRLISPPYDVLDTQEALAMAEGNEVSFLHVNKPEIDLPADTDPYADIVYQKGRENLFKFVANGWLSQDEEARMYIYSVSMDGRTQFGLVCGASVDDYKENKIKKHELTRQKKEEDRTKLTDIQGANIGPVFLTYPAQENIDQLVASIVSRQPWINVTTDDNIVHVLWKCTVEESENFTQMFAQIPASYIADGHHRAASAFNVGELRRKRAEEAGQAITGNEDFHYFLSIHYPHNQLFIYDYNRVVKDLNGLTPEQFLERLQENFEVSEISDRKPPAKHHFSLFLNGRWTGLRVRPEKIPGTDPVSTLDSQLLTTLCLDPILGIQDLRTSDRVDFIGGIRGLDELERRCGVDCVAAFALFPVQVEEVMAIADAEQIMPPKTTWFEPKPRSGMVVRIFSS